MTKERLLDLIAKIIVFGFIGIIMIALIFGLAVQIIFVFKDSIFWGLATLLIPIIIGVAFAYLMERGIL